VARRTPTICARNNGDFLFQNMPSGAGPPGAFAQFPERTIAIIEIDPDGVFDMGTLGANHLLVIFSGTVPLPERGMDIILAKERKAGRPRR